ncbi:MAG: hypothetical protein HY762_09605, partial [Planctomycetes bacterium]|nr:hypothetical protein [Planctomycetota bacterium]
YQSARLTIHRLLGELGAPEGLDDLLLLLGDGTKRVHEDVLETIAKIGNRNALVPLIRLYSVEANISEYGTRHIKAACRDIMRREKIAPSDKLFQQLPQQEKEALKNILYRNRKNVGNGNND